MRLENRRGADHPGARFTPAEAEAIRRRCAERPAPTLRAVAREYDCGRMTVSRILHRETYRR
jgi:transposase-like protein